MCGKIVDRRLLKKSSEARRTRNERARAYVRSTLARCD
jgi:hypothetical protein